MLYNQPSMVNYGDGIVVSQLLELNRGVGVVVCPVFHPVEDIRYLLATPHVVELADELELWQAADHKEADDMISSYERPRLPSSWARYANLRVVPPVETERYQSVSPGEYLWVNPSVLSLATGGVFIQTGWDQINRGEVDNQLDRNHRFLRCLRDRAGWLPPGSWVSDVRPDKIVVILYDEQVALQLPPQTLLCVKVGFKLPGARTYLHTHQVCQLHRHLELGDTQFTRAMTTQLLHALSYLPDPCITLT